MNKSSRRTFLARLLGGAAAVMLLYAVAGFIVAPPLVERRLAGLAQERLGQTLTIEKMRINPFALSVEARGVQLAHANDTVPFAVRRIYLNLDLLGSGFGRGWVLSEAQTEGLQLQLELQRNGRLNYADLAQRWRQASPPAEAGGAPLRLTVKHLLASDGALTYRKFSGAPAETRVLPIRLELLNVSTLPQREGQYDFSARLADGGAVTWRGDVSLVPLQSEGDLTLDGLKLATAWKFFRDELLLDEPQGTVSLATHYKFSYADGKPELGLTGMRVKAADLRVAREGLNDPILSLKALDVREGTFELGKRVLTLPVVSLSDGRVNVARNVTGAWNWTGFLREREAPAQTLQPPDNAEAAVWHIEMHAVEVADVGLHYADRQRAKPVMLQTASLHGKARISVAAGGETLEVRAQEMNLRLDKLLLPSADAPAVKLTQLRIEGGHVDLAQQTLGASRLILDGGTLVIDRGEDGAVALTQAFAAGGATPSPASRWRYAVGSVRVQNLDVALSDRGFGKLPIAYQLNGVSANLDNIASEGSKPLAFKATAKIRSGGSLAASGSAAPDLSRVDVRAKLDALALAPLQPLITRYAAVDLASGSASADITLAMRRNEGGTSLSATGPFELANVRLNEAGKDVTVLAWERLSSAEARLTLGPDRLLIKEIIVQAPEAKIDISEKREINLVKLFKHDAATGPVKAPAARGEAKQSAFALHIGELRVRDGTLDFADRSLALPFSTQVTNFSGTASGLGTNRERYATLDFEGDIGEFGSAQIDGRIDAFNAKTFTEIDAAFANVELPDLTPYSVTFLGRKIASGRLWVDLKYGIQKGQLTGENDITIRDLRLGDPVNSPNALKLPLDLAVALLTDAEGKIRTAVPVTGDLNNPKFDMGAVIREAIGNLIVKIVSAPVRALASLFGGGREGPDIGAVQFDAGSAKLLPSEKEKLQEVAEVMSERPQLKLTVHAPYAPASDRAALQREMANRDVALELGRSLEPGEKPAPVVFDSIATQRALEKLLSKKADAAAVRDLVAQYTKRTGAAPKRVAMFDRKPGSADFYETMYARLIAAQRVSDEAVAKLAQGRADVVLTTLRSAGIDADRLAPGPVEKSKQEQDKRVSAELSLEPVKGQRPPPLEEAPEEAQASR